MTQPMIAVLLLLGIIAAGLLFVVDYHVTRLFVNKKGGTVEKDGTIRWDGGWPMSRAVRHRLTELGWRRPLEGRPNKGRPHIRPPPQHPRVPTPLPCKEPKKDDGLTYVGLRPGVWSIVVGHSGTIHVWAEDDVTGEDRLEREGKRMIRFRRQNVYGETP